MKILLIEDNIVLIKTLQDLLESNNYEVDYVVSLDEIDDYIVLNTYDIVILDLMLGKDNGLEYLKLIRDEIRTPIIILTAKDTKEDIIKGFSLGADDYITKPFDADILLARIKSKIYKKNSVIKYKSSKFDFDRFVVTKNGKTVQLTQAEARILKYLYINRGIFMTKEQILNSTSDNLNVKERVVVSHIYNIRQKLLEIGSEDPIENKWKVGYRWTES